MNTQQINNILANPKEHDWMHSDDSLIQWCDEVFKRQQEMMK